MIHIHLNHNPPLTLTFGFTPPPLLQKLLSPFLPLPRLLRGQMGSLGEEEGWSCMGPGGRYGEV